MLHTSAPGRYTLHADLRRGVVSLLNPHREKAPPPLSPRIDRIDGRSRYYNFTASAETRNDENLLIIHDPEVAALFVAEFGRVYEQARTADTVP
ncbi:MAG: hypothetical protein SXV54_25730 [Chloroflexota bacterium]|nr:hypothetical protein [Chloroflexota bacterium]